MVSVHIQVCGLALPLTPGPCGPSLAEPSWPSYCLPAGVMPKRGLDVCSCEIFRFYKLITTKSLIEPVSMIVPRRVRVVGAICVWGRQGTPPGEDSPRDLELRAHALGAATGRLMASPKGKAFLVVSGHPWDLGVLSPALELLCDIEHDPVLSGSHLPQFTGVRGTRPPSSVRALPVWVASPTSPALTVPASPTVRILPRGHLPTHGRGPALSDSPGMAPGDE